MKDGHDLEIYACIVGYPDYLVTSYGRIISLKFNKLKEIKNTVNKTGYSNVCLSINGNQKTFSVHRLVALSFISNKNNYKEINHKDENKQNNSIYNLEWCDRKYNCNYGNHNKKLSERQKGVLNSRARGIMRINEKTGEIKCYSYIKQCEKDGFDKTCVWACCNGRANHHKGYKWKYFDKK